VVAEEVLDNADVDALAATGAGAFLGDPPLRDRVKDTETAVGPAAGGATSPFAVLGRDDTDAAVDGVAAATAAFALAVSREVDGWGEIVGRAGLVSDNTFALPLRAGCKSG